MTFFRFLFRLSLLCTVLATGAWGKGETPQQKAERNAWQNINRLYLDYVYANENERLLKALMVAVSRVDDINKFDVSPEGISLQGNQTRVREFRLTRLVTEAFRYSMVTISVLPVDSTPSSHTCMSHLLQQFSQAKALRERQDVFHWYKSYKRVLNGLTAKDRNDSLENLIKVSVKNSFREFPDPPESERKLAEQLAFILLEMQERFIRGKALRSLGHKIHKQMQNHAVSRDPAFPIYVEYLTQLYRQHPTLWHMEPSRRHYQKDLANLFFTAKVDQPQNDKKWFDEVKAILGGKMPKSKLKPKPKPKPKVKSTPASVPPQSVRYRDDDDCYDCWVTDKNVGYFFLAIPAIGVTSLVITTIYNALGGNDKEQQLIVSKKTSELKRKLGKALNKPGRKDPKGSDWRPTDLDRQEVKGILQGVDQRIYINLLTCYGLLPPLGCQMNLDDLILQIQLQQLYASLRREHVIYTEDDRRRDDSRTRPGGRQTIEVMTPPEPSISQQGQAPEEEGDVGYSDWSFFNDGSPVNESPGWGTATTSEIQGREAEWNYQISGSTDLL